jgi:hypothetical protein
VVSAWMLGCWTDNYGLIHWNSQSCLNWSPSTEPSDHRGLMQLNGKGSTRSYIHKIGAGGRGFQVCLESLPHQLAQCRNGMQNGLTVHSFNHSLEIGLCRGGCRFSSFASTWLCFEDGRPRVQYKPFAWGTFLQ